MNSPSIETRAASSDLPPLITIVPSSGWVRLNLRELWNYRELLVFLIWRDLKVRYRQTALGAAWAILQPFLTMVVFSVFFGKLAGIPSDGIPYPIFVYAGLLPWQIFSHALTESSNSLVLNQQLITKVYFPRLTIPFSAVLAGLADFAFAFILFLGMMVYYGIVPTLAVITFPLFLLLAIATALAVGLWLSALNVQYRDVRYIIPFLTQFWLFVTPIAYSTNLVPETWRLIYGLNPMVGVVNGFRWALLGYTTAQSSLFIVSIIVVAVLLIGGLAYFNRMEKTFADII